MTTPAVPTGWYEDPYGTDAERFHDGTRWTGRTRVADSPAVVSDLSPFPPAPTAPRPAPTAPRPTGQRVLMVAPVVAAALALVAVPIPIHRPWSMLIPAITTAAIIATVGRFVSYRWRSAVLAFIFPPWGAFVVIEIAWRLTFLPYRDWQGPADDDWQGQVDDGADWIRVTHPSVKTPLYVRRSFLGSDW